MKLLPLWITLCIWLGASSCQTGQNSQPKAESGQYHVSGKILNAGAKSMFLDRLGLQSNETIDTTIIAQDGKFTFKGKLPEKGLYMLRIDPQHSWLLVIDENPIVLQGDYQDIYQYNVQGNPELQSLTPFIQALSQQQKKLSDLLNEFNQTRSVPASDPGKLLLIQEQYQQAYNEMQQSIVRMADTTDSDLLRIFAGSLLNVEEHEENIKRWMEKTPESNQNTYIQQFRNRYTEATRFSTGRQAPDFTLKSHKGENLNLSELKGKIVLIDFWASWCRPCRVENPQVVKMYQKYQPKGFEIYSVSLDQTMQKWVDAIQQDNLFWKYHGSELKGWNCSVAKQYGVNSIPATFLLDRDGQIIAKNLRGTALEQKLSEIFGS